MRAEQLDLQHEPRLSSSRRGLLSQQRGTFLAGLSLTFDDGTTDSHFMVYDARRQLLIDNKAGAEVPEVKASDLKSNRAAKAVFFHYFNAEVVDVKLCSVHRFTQLLA